MKKSDCPFLIVEDSPEDYTVLVRAFHKIGIENPIYHFQEGDEALAFLFRAGSYATNSAPPPCFILLDLNLPGTDGREVLRAVKADEALSVIPVIVFSTSTHEVDVRECYRLGANCYIQKPVAYEDHLDLMRRLTEFWLTPEFTRLVAPPARLPAPAAGS